MRTTLLALAVALGLPHVPVSAGTTAPPFVLRINVESPPTKNGPDYFIVKAGSLVLVDAYLTNNSKHGLQLGQEVNSRTGVCFGHEYEILDGNGNAAQKVVISHPEIGSSGHGWPPLILKPGESKFICSDRVNGLYDLTHAGDYTIQLLLAISPNLKADRVRSNTIALRVTDDDSVIEKTLLPFALQIDAFSPDLKSGMPVVVKAGKEIDLTIGKTNSSKHEIDCSINRSKDKLDDNFQYDVRDSSGNPVARHTIDKPLSQPSLPYRHECAPGQYNWDVVGKVTGLYDLSRPGRYTIQVSQPVSDNPEDGVVKSNTISVTVTR